MRVSLVLAGPGRGGEACITGVQVACDTFLDPRPWVISKTK